MKTAPRSDERQKGAILVMVLIFAVLLYIVVSQLVTTAKMARLAGENDVLLVKMDNHIKAVALPQTQQTLLDDLDAAAAEEAAGEGGNQMGGLGGAEGGEGEEEPPSDSSQDAWFNPTAHSSGDINVYVWVEDENRKLNILSLISKDEEFARLSKERLLRLIDSLRENTDFDITQGDATTMVEQIKEWLDGRNRTEDYLPRPPLKTNDDAHTKTVPLHLDELLLLRMITKDIFYDKVIEDDKGEPMLLPGLESVLTIYTSWRVDPGDPQKQARNAQADPNAAGGNTGNTGNTGGAANEAEDDPEPEGEGIRVNINTVTRPVLRSLFTYGEIPDTVIDAILRYRNEELPEDEQEEAADEDYMGDVNEGVGTEKQIFKTLEDLEKIQEFKNLPDPKVKQQFLDMLTVNSDVFSIHFAALYKRNEERKVYVLSRRRSVVVRIEGEDEPRLHPVIHLERRHGLRIFPIDFPQEERERREENQMDMDEFALEEQGWNPFHLEFFRKSDDDR